MADTIETNPGEADDSILKKRGRFRRVNSDPINISTAIINAQKIFGNDPILNDSTTAELLCCLATSSSASYDFDDTRSEVYKAKAQRIKSRSKDDSEMNLQTQSQDTFVGRFLQDKKNSGSDRVFSKNHTFSAEDETYLLSLLPSISVDTNDMQHLDSKDHTILRRELSGMSDTDDLLKGLSDSYDFTRSREIGYSDLMPPPIVLPSHLGSSSNAMDTSRTSGTQADGIAYAFPTRTLPKKSPSLYMSPARMTLSKAASVNHALMEQRKMAKEKSHTSVAALNEFGMIQVDPANQQHPDEVIANQSQSVSDISTVPSGSLGSSSTSSGGVNVDGPGGKNNSPPQAGVQMNISGTGNSSNPRLVQRSTKSLNQIDSASGDPSQFDALLQQFRQRSDSTRSLNSSSWSINSGISSMSIGDLTRSTDTAQNHQHTRQSKHYPRLVEILTAASTDEMEQSVSTAEAIVPNKGGGGALHNSHAAAHGGHHNANSNIVHHHAKDNRSKHHELLRRQDAVSTRYDAAGLVQPQLWTDSHSSASGVLQQSSTHNTVAPGMQTTVPVTPVGTDNSTFTTYYVPVSGTSTPAVGSGFIPPTVDTSMPMPSIDYTYSSSNGGTPRNCFPGSVSVTSESYSYHNSNVYTDDNSVAAAMSSLSYGLNAGNGIELSNLVPSFNSAAGYYVMSGLGNSSSSAMGYSPYNQNAMASSNTLSYLAEIKGENNLFKEKAKPQRYVGRSSYRCGKCGMPKVNHVCTIVDTLITGVEVQTVQPAWNPKAKPVATERVLTISKRKTITEEFDYDEHHNRYNITQPRRDIFAKKQAQQQAAQRQLEIQQMQSALQMYSADGYSPSNYQQQLMYQELLARTRSSSTLISSSQSQYSSYNSTPSVTPTAAAAVAKMSLASNNANNSNSVASNK